MAKERLTLVSSLTWEWHTKPRHSPASPFDNWQGLPSSQPNATYVPANMTYTAVRAPFIITVNIKDKMFQKS